MNCNLGIGIEVKDILQLIVAIIQVVVTIYLAKTAYNISLKNLTLEVIKRCHEIEVHFKNSPITAKEEQKKIIDKVLKNEKERKTVFSIFGIESSEKKTS